MAHSSHEHSSHGHGAHAHHVIPQKTLFLVFMMLIGLMVATIVAAFAFPGLNTVAMNAIALGIATTKAAFVVTVFMGVKYSTRVVRLFALGGFAWFFLMFIMLADYTTRPTEAVVGWEEQPATALPRYTAEQPD